MKTNQTKLLLLLLFIFLSGLLTRCTKDQIETQSKDNIEGLYKVQNKALGLSQSQLLNKTGALKDLFEQLKIGDRLNPVTSNLHYTPDWNHPKIMKGNDTTVYYLYPIVITQLIGDKQVKAVSFGFKSYLIIKNEKEFFHGVYIKTPSKDVTKIDTAAFSLRTFTGELKFDNLLTGKLSIIPYENGKVAESYNSKAKKKKGEMTTLGYENRCITITDCVWNTLCQNMPMIYLARGCYYPQPAGPSSMCREWQLSYTTDREVCEDYWVPDPPIDPGTGGGGGGGGGGGDSGGIAADLFN